MKTKVCIKCGNRKKLNEFPTDKSKKDGFRADCKKCQSDIQKQRYHANHPDASYKNLPIRYNESGEIIKKCIVCNLDLTLDCFCKAKEGSFGRMSECKMCRSKKRIEEYHLKNPHARRLIKREIKFNENGEAVLECMNPIHTGKKALPLKEFRIRDGKQISTCKMCEKNVNDKYKKEHRAAILEQRKIKRQTVKHKLKRKEYDAINRERDRARQNHRRKNDPMFKFKANLRGRLHQAFRDILNIKKNKHTFDLIGMQPLELMKYIEEKFDNRMTWENYGYYGWHVDHIIPLSCAKTEDKMIELCHYSNLQPLWWDDNISKGNKLPDGTRAESSR